MKTEQECMDRLEAVIDNISQYLKNFPEGERGESMPPLKQAEISMLIGVMLGLGYTLDMERAMLAIFHKMKVTMMAERFKEAFERN